MNYAKLYFTYIKRYIIGRLEYKKDSILSIFNFVITNAAALASIYFIMAAVPQLEGWTMEEIGFLYGFVLLPVGLDHILFDDFWNVAYRNVKDGALDRMFLRPIPVIFQVIAETFQIEGLGDLLVGLVMVIVFGCQIHIQWSFGVILLFIVSTIFGAFIISGLKIMCSSVAFKTKSSGPLLQVVYNFTNYVKYPRIIYPVAIQVILTVAFPYMLFISYPVEIALGKIALNPYLLSGIIALAGAAFFALSLVVWNFFAKKYESTGN